jgi:hypothetical protein
MDESLLKKNKNIKVYFLAKLKLSETKIRPKQSVIGKSSKLPVMSLGSGAGGLIRTIRSSESGTVSRIVSGGASSAGGTSGTCIVNAGSAGVSSN